MDYLQLIVGLSGGLVTWYLLGHKNQRLPSMVDLRESLLAIGWFGLLALFLLAQVFTFAAGLVFGKMLHAKSVIMLGDISLTVTLGTVSIVCLATSVIATLITLGFFRLDHDPINKRKAFLAEASIFAIGFLFAFGVNAIADMQVAALSG